MNKQEAAVFLKDLVSKIEVSNKKEVFDAAPVLFFIQETKTINAADGYGNGTWYINDDDSENAFNSEEDLNEFLEDNEDYSRDDYHEVSTQEVEQTQDLAFLTRESCQDHIDSNSYHYTKPITYSRGVWRDPLMKGLFESLNVLFGKEIKCTK